MHSSHCTVHASDWYPQILIGILGQPHLTFWYYNYNVRQIPSYHAMCSSYRGLIENVIWFSFRDSSDCEYCQLLNPNAKNSKMDLQHISPIATSGFVPNPNTTSLPPDRTIPRPIWLFTDMTCPFEGSRFLDSLGYSFTVLRVRMEWDCRFHSESVPFSRAPAALSRDSTYLLYPWFILPSFPNRNTKIGIRQA